MQPVTQRGQDVGWMGRLDWAGVGSSLFVVAGDLLDQSTIRRRNFGS